MKLASGLALLLALLCFSLALAVDRSTLAVEHIEGSGWSASGLRLDLDFEAAGLAVRLSIEELTVAPARAVVRDVTLECTEVEITDTKLACDRASVRLRDSPLGAQTFSSAVVYDRIDRALELSLQDVQVAGGGARMHAHLGPNGWNARVVAQAVQIAESMELLRRLGAPTPEWVAQGTATIVLQAAGHAADVREVHVHADVQELTANNPEGSLASDRLALEARASFERTGSDWSYSARVKSASGQAFVQPLFFDFGARAMELQARGQWCAAKHEVRIDEFAVRHSGTLSARGFGMLALGGDRVLQELTLELQKMEFPAAYETYLQPFATQGSLSALQTAGTVSGQLSLHAGTTRAASLRVHDLSARAADGSLAVTGLQASVEWSAQPASAPAASFMRWQGASLLGLQLGPAELSFTAFGGSFRLLRSARIPLFDGAIDVQSLRARNIGKPSLAFIIDAQLEPVSVQHLCRAFGWPEFGGRIGGVISKLRMREGSVTLGTTLHASVFDGQVQVRDLRLEQPFGEWPRMHASFDLDNLDLEMLTQAFSFGRITGRLSGNIEGLQLFDWMPVAFDAHLFTPPNDRSPHRISQRAVQNIGSIGGSGSSVTAALSSGFLRFFEEFRYERLGISCRLHNDVCEMRGVAPAPQGGYYLVKGRGLPRIDVIGNARRVNWPRLVRQLQHAIESEGAVVD